MDGKIGITEDREDRSQPLPFLPFIQEKRHANSTPRPIEPEDWAPGKQQVPIRVL